MTALGRSRFVTFLGFALAGIGLLSVPGTVTQAHQVLQVFQQPGVREAVIQQMGGANLGPISRLAIEYAEVTVILAVVQALALLAVGIGLIWRSAWGLKLGAVLLLVGALRQGGLLVQLLLYAPPVPPGLTAEQARQASTPLIFLYLGSLAWLAFLAWKFTRPSIKAEFSMGTAAEQ